MRAHLRHWVYWSGFFLNASLAISAYINSSFFASFVGEERVGLIYTLADVFTVVLALYAHKLVEHLGIREMLTRVLAGSLAALIGLLVFAGFSVSIFFLAVNLVLAFLLAASLDLYLEHLSENKNTGKIRGWFLTLINLAWLFSPLLASQLNARYGFGAVYAVSALALLPLAYIAFWRLENVPRRSYRHISLSRTIRDLWRAKVGEPMADLRRIITIDFLLQFFYATMVVYLPILLHQHLGFSWSQIGVILTIMLVPFVILDLILGRVADDWLGEKELLIAALAIAGVSTLAIPLFGAASLWAWAGLLFATRVGAATVEMMKESYLFKKVNSDDVSAIFLSRSMYPLSYIVAPLAGTLILTFAPIQAIFAIMGVLVLGGIPLAMKLKDTR
jgi:MFS family permease